MSERKPFEYEVIETHGVLSRNGSTSKEVRRVSVNGGEAKVDIRTWRRLADGSERMYRGITLNQEELDALREILNDLY